MMLKYVGGHIAVTIPTATTPATVARGELVDLDGAEDVAGGLLVCRGWEPADAAAEALALDLLSLVTGAPSSGPPALDEMSAKEVAALINENLLDTELLNWISTAEDERPQPRKTVLEALSAAPTNETE